MMITSRILISENVLDKMRDHWEKHKTKYLIGGGAALLGAANPIIGAASAGVGAAAYLASQDKKKKKKVQQDEYQY